MRKNTGGEGSRHRGRKCADHAQKAKVARTKKKRARRRSEKLKKTHQGELFYTGPPAQRRFASGKKVGRPREEGSCQRHEERPTRNPRNPLHVTLAADAHADDA